MKLEIGDVVQLQSGSLKMTVERLEDSKNVKCVWFDSKQELQRCKFTKKSLKKYEGNS